MKTVRKAFDILKLIAEEPEYSYPLREISVPLKMNISTCNLLLKSLVEIGAVEQKSSRQGYSLGPLLYHLTRNGPYRKDISVAAELFLHGFTKKTGETILLSVYHRNQKKRIQIASADGNQAVNIRLQNLLLDDLYQSASGRLLTAYLPPDELNAVLTKYGYPKPDEWMGSDTKKGLERNLESIRKKGMIAIESRINALGLIAFPVRQGEQVVAVVGSPVPLFRFSREKKRLIKELKETAEKISRAISKQKTGNR